MRNIVFIALTWAGLLLAQPVQAWSAFGHRLVAQLAAEQVSPATRSQLDALLAQEPGADLVSIAAWADTIRDLPEYRGTGPFHYINFPDASCRYEAARDCAEGRCIVAALTHYAGILGDTTRPAPERLEALKFVVHFVGDIHQPLHAGHRNDRGGNRFQVSIKQKNGKTQGSNLHAVWDEHLLRSAGLNLSKYQARLAPQLAETNIGSMAFSSWAESSCALLDEAGIYPAKPGRLPSTYLEQHRPLAEARIVLAAARLAVLLDTLLGH